MVLHTVNKSPLSCQSLAQCLKVMGPADSLLLMEDGVYGALSSVESATGLNALGKAARLYVLKEDVDARGLEGRLLSDARLVDYAGFVDLVVSHSASMAWL